MAGKSPSAVRTTDTGTPLVLSLHDVFLHPRLGGIDTGVAPTSRSRGRCAERVDTNEESLSRTAAFDARTV